MKPSRNLPLDIAGGTLLTVWVILAAFPFAWMAILSLRTPLDAFAQPPPLLAPITFANFRAVWLDDGFWRPAINSALITFGTVSVSLTIGCLAAYALARYRGSLGFWLLMAALVFRAMPHVVLLTAYKPAFFQLGLWNRYETLIVVMVAINQPFTIWMLRSFFVNIPAELDEAALVDGCTRLQAFRRVIMPVMWPGVVTAGLFSFLLAYNDYLISSQLMNGDHMTMTAALSNYMNSNDDSVKLLRGIAGAVSVCLPLVVLIGLFQRQIVAGLVQGAVKG